MSSVSCNGCQLSSQNRTEIIGIVKYLNGRLKESFDKLTVRLDELDERLTEIEVSLRRKNDREHEIRFEMFPSDDEDDE